jgi:hypothetical protein
MKSMADVCIQQTHNLGNDLIEVQPRDFGTARLHNIMEIVGRPLYSNRSVRVVLCLPYAGENALV